MDRVVQGLLNVKLIEESDLPLIRSTYLIDVDYSYPVPTVDRNAALATIQSYLRERDILSRGRFGAWQYEIGNMDHSVMQGVEVVNSWLLGEKEVTWKEMSAAKPLVIHHREESAPLYAISGKGLVEANRFPFTLAQNAKAKPSPAKPYRTNNNANVQPPL